MKEIGFSLKPQNNALIFFSRFFPYNLKINLKMQVATKGYSGSCTLIRKINK